MKRNLALVVAATAVVVVALFASQFMQRPVAPGIATSAPSPGTALAQGIPVPPTGSYVQTGISVTGDGRITVQPDLAQITVGVEVSNKSAAAAQQQAATQMDAVVSQLKQQGIAEKDIQTVRYDLSPEYDYSTRTPVLNGYRATNLAMVKVRDISKVGPILDAITASGATRIQGISFSVSDPTAATTAGRDEAMKNAFTKADQLAKAAGVGLGAPVLIEEISSAPPVPIDISARQAAPAAGIAAPTPINPGTQEVAVSVRVIYAIK